MENSAEQRTQTVGTPIYMAPEQFRSEGRVSPATDIYALGMLAYTLLVGVHYWSEEHERCENPFAFASVAVHGPKEPPSYRAAREEVELPPEFDAWFVRATARWPQDRYVSATSAIVALAEALGVETPVVPLTIPPPPPSHVSSGVALAPTIESPSGRLSSPGLRTGSTGGASVRARSTGSQPGREQHTEVSLSVTSGGEPLPIEEGPHRRPGRIVAIAAFVAIAAAVVVAGIGRFRASRDTARVDPPAASASTAAAKAPKAADSQAVPTEQEPNVTRIDELPLAPPEPAAESPDHAASEPSRRAPAAGAGHVRRRAGSPDHRESTSPTPSEPGTPEPAESPRATEAPAPQKPPNRDSLYGRY